MPTILDWSSTAATNANADSEINWAEGMPPSSVNDSARVMMKRIRDYVSEQGGSIAATGSANTLRVVVPSGLSDYLDGLRLTFRAVATNTAACTLSVNSIGARPLLMLKPGGFVALAGGELVLGGIYEVFYQAALNSGNGAFLVSNPTQGEFSIGDYKSTARSAEEPGWFFCDGRAVSRTTYAALFSVIGTTYGAGNGSTTFNIPDWRGRVGAGRDNMGGTDAARLGFFGTVARTLGGSMGAALHVLTLGQMPFHGHSASTGAAGRHSHTVGASYIGSGNSSTGGYITPTGTGAATSEVPEHTHSVSVDGAGGGEAHPNVQPTIICNVLIKYA